MNSLGLYIHIPFCRAKCAYCDFNSYPGLDSLHNRYVQAVVAEIRLMASEHGPLPVDSVYIGGGTPTVLPVPLLIQLLAACQAHFDLAPSAEITVEANPGTVDPGVLQNLRVAGVNRLSLGIQSFSDPELRLLGRIHSADQSRQAVATARQAGFENLSLDLIYNLPGQSLSDWSFSLEQALQRTPEHLSLYALSLEEDTPLANGVARGELSAPDPDVAADMYILAEECLWRACYVHYEISNWARRATATRAAAQAPHSLCHSEHREESRPIERTKMPLTCDDHERSQHVRGDCAPQQDEILHCAQDDIEEQRRAPVCRHNLKYWRREPYFGLGAGAHSFFREQRYYNVADPEDYVLRTERGSSVQESDEVISVAEAMGEAMILGLRLMEGIGVGDFTQRYGHSPRALYSSQLAELTQLNLIEVTPDILRLTPRGRLLANRVFGYFWPPRQG
jgi:putative oxygen-independent coproporphyrinogen III oxidase